VNISPSTAAYYALIAVCFVALGAILTGDLDKFSIAERGTVLGGIVAVLAGVAYIGHRRNKENGP
jgi:hypothetical protein